jgi:hypothetical protein
MAINLIHGVVFLVVCAVTAALIYLGKSGGVKATVQRLAAVDPINEAIGRLLRLVDPFSSQPVP